MRITPTQVEALNPFLQNNNGALYLYGSRVDDNARGGDIDLLLVMDEKTIAEKLRDKKHYLLSAIKKYIGDQKIDLLISDKEDSESDAFIKLVMPSAVLLKLWD